MKTKKTPICFLLHCRTVCLEKGELVKPDVQELSIQVQFDGTVESDPGIVEVVKREIALRQVQIRNDIIRLKPNRYACLFNGLAVLAQGCVIGSQIRMGRIIPLVDLSPYFVCLDFLQQVTRDDASVFGTDRRSGRHGPTPRALHRRADRPQGAATARSR